MTNKVKFDLFRYLMALYGKCEYADSKRLIISDEASTMIRGVIGTKNLQ